MIRAFIAVELPLPLKNFLAELTSRLLREVPSNSLQWVHTEGMHLTLKFLGTIPESQLPQLDAQLEPWLKNQAPFRIQIGGLGCFPNLLRPRVVWVGAKSQAGQLQQLQKEMEGRLSEIGFSSEARPFAGHLTLGRVRPSVGREKLRQIGEAVSHLQETEQRFLDVGWISLFRSDLQPTGAVYTRLREWRLGERS